MIEIKHLEDLVGPLPKGRALKQSLEEIKSVTNDIALLMLRLTELPPKIDAALNEAYERLKQQAEQFRECPNCGERFLNRSQIELARRAAEAEAELSRLREHLKSADTGGWFYAYDEQLQKRIAAEAETRKLRQLLAICDACHEPIKAVPRSQTSVAQTARDANLAAVEKCWHEAEAEAREWEQVAREYAKAKDSLDLTLNDILARHAAEHGGDT